jgi:hypothetical protein
MLHEPIATPAESNKPVRHDDGLWITIDPVSDHTIGDKFNITGTTNLPAGEKILVEIISSRYKPGSQCQCSDFGYGATGTIQITEGSNGMNRWVFMVDTSYFKPDEMIVIVTTTGKNEVTAHTSFNISGE